LPLTCGGLRRAGNTALKTERREVRHPTILRVRICHPVLKWRVLLRPVGPPKALALQCAKRAYIPRFCGIRTLRATDV
jgi:hypothetical protein